MRFIGSKKNMLEKIGRVIDNHVVDESNIFVDLFAGTGIVGEYFKPRYKIISNDMLYFSSILLGGKIENNSVPYFNKLSSSGIIDPLSYLNNTSYKIDDTYFITINYSPYEENERMYFTVENASRIDFIRQTIEKWKNKNLINKNEYNYLLSCLIEAVPFVSNTSGTYGAYLKHWDKRALKPLELCHLNIVNNNQENKVYNEDSNKLIKNLKGDICYVDTPYNGRQYSSNYHVLETIAKYDYPTIKGVTGIRKFSKEESSLYCKKSTVRSAFRDLIKNINMRHIIVSYSSEGILEKEEIESLLKEYGIEKTYICYEFPYRKYRGKIRPEENKLKEYLFYVQKDVQLCQSKSIEKSSISVAKNSSELLASPMNYIGGKYKILPQLLPLFPKDIDTFVDLFAGGLNVGINVESNKIIANDFNHYVIEILDIFYKTNIDVLLENIDEIIEKYGLSRTNKSGFLKLREEYNRNQTPLVLYTLICYSFNYQFRFNNNREYNNPFGKNRSHFSDKLREKLIKFSQRLKEKEIQFTTYKFEKVVDFKLSKKDFVYCDPPYFITTGSYNDGNRGFKDWTLAQELKLYETLDILNSRGIRFALSNVLEHKGKKNYSLIEWSDKYKIIHLNNDYSNSSHNTIIGNSDEVLIVNY